MKLVFGTNLKGDINQLMIKFEPAVDEIVFTKKPKEKKERTIKMTEKAKEGTKPLEGNSKEHTVEEENNIFSTDEIKIEDMAIDGICGVY